MKNLNYSKELGPQIDELIAEGTSREESLRLIEDYRLANPCKASAEAHYNSRPGHFLKDGSISSMKAENSKGKAAAADKAALSSDEMIKIQAAAIALYGKPLVGPSDVPFVSRREFEIIYQALLGLEKQGIIEFFGAAMAKIEAADKAAAIEKAMALLKANGIETRKAAAWDYGY